MFPSEIVIFPGLRLSHGHFGQQVSESIVSQLQNGVSTSSLPFFCVDLLTFKVYPRSNSFFQWEFCVKWLISQADYNRPKQQRSAMLPNSGLKETESYVNV